MSVTVLLCIYSHITDILWSWSRSRWLRTEARGARERRHAVNVCLSMSEHAHRHAWQRAYVEHVHIYACPAFKQALPENATSCLRTGKRVVRHVCWSINVELMLHDHSNSSYICSRLSYNFSNARLLFPLEKNKIICNHDHFIVYTCSDSNNHFCNNMA